MYVHFFVGYVSECGKYWVLDFHVIHCVDR